MKQIVLDYNDYQLDDETIKQLQKAELCNEEIQKRRPFEGELLKQVRDFYKIDTTWSSSALEGNSYTISETKIMLEDGITVGGKPLKHTLEICGHGDAYDYMFSLVRNSELCIEDVREIHRRLMQKEIGADAGNYKTEENLITGSNYTTVGAKRVSYEMERLAVWMKENAKKMHPIQFAAEVHRALVYIHPFPDGNGRTARLAMNAILIQNGYLPCVIAPIIRLDYIQALEAGRSGQKNDFVKFIAEAETETEKDFIRAMHMEMPDFSQLNRTKDSLDQSESKQEKARMDWKEDMLQEMKGINLEQ